MAFGMPELEMSSGRLGETLKKLAA